MVCAAAPRRLSLDTFESHWVTKNKKQDCTYVRHYLQLNPTALQLASKAQKASVTKGEVHRYLEYDARHGAKYIESTNDVEMDDDDW
jgi:hypothetical protein